MSNQLDHYYDGQLRRYLTQIIRMMSGFSYKDSSGNIKTVPVMYGDITRQIGSILRDNSENKIPSAPRMSVYVTALELDSSRLADSSYVNRVNIRERAFDLEGNEYLKTEGKNYTVERLMPTPYNLTVSLDIWSTNTDQKLQIIEQLLMLFNPSLEIQTTDNYLDWTSLSTVRLDTVTWSSRSIPQGTESEIDVATLSFITPIYIAPPAKVKRMGVITDIISRIHNSKQDLVDATTDIDFTLAEGDAVTDSNIFINNDGDLERARALADYEINESIFTTLKTTYQNLDLLVMNNTAKLVRNGVVGAMNWPQLIEALPGKFNEGISQLRLRRSDYNYDIVGEFAVSPTNIDEAVINWDIDSLPTDTVFASSTGERSKIDYIIDPTKSNPQDLDLSANPRILILASIGNAENTDGADAWKNLDGSDAVADANSIIEWNGSSWETVFDPSQASENETYYTTNLNTSIQYKFQNSTWLLSVEGEYPNGTWTLDF
jgi:hypothetical protein